jgi:hypothetical protein
VPRELIDPPHAHLDGPCHDGCYRETPEVDAVSDAKDPAPRQMVFKDAAPEDTSDGFHTFAELYDHRRALTAVLAALAAPKSSWRSKQHHPDGDPMFEGGWFIVGIELDTGTISYHYELKYWDDFAAVPVLEHAPLWDGHTPADVIDRLNGVARLVAEGPFGDI